MFVYRLLATGTMEEKIYHRQVTKNALASQVLDKEQKNRHFKEQELINLYNFDPEGIEEVGSGDDNTEVDDVSGNKKDDTACVSSNRVTVRGQNKLRNCTDAMPSDLVLVCLLGKMQPKWLLRYADHDALATGDGEAELSTEDQAVAWAEYEAAEAASKAQEKADAASRVEMTKRAADHQHPSNILYKTSVPSDMPQNKLPHNQYGQQYINRPHADAPHDRYNQQHVNMPHIQLPHNQINHHFPSLPSALPESDTPHNQINQDFPNVPSKFPCPLTLTNHIWAC